MVQSQNHSANNQSIHCPPQLHSSPKIVTQPHVFVLVVKQNSLLLYDHVNNTFRMREPIPTQPTTTISCFTFVFFFFCFQPHVWRLVTVIPTNASILATHASLLTTIGCAHNQPDAKNKYFFFFYFFFFSNFFSFFFFQHLSPCNHMQLYKLDNPFQYKIGQNGITC